MASLTESAYYARRAVTIFVILIIGIFVLRTSWRLAKNIWGHVVPPKPPSPTMAFGKLPKIKFPDQEKLQLNFKLETISGSLSSLGNIAKVYFIPEKQSGLLNLDRAKVKAQKLGFVGEPKAISDTVYRWESQAKTLEININNDSFTLRYPYENDTSLFIDKNFSDEQQLAIEAKNYLKAADYLPQDLENGNVEFVYFKFSPPNLTPVSYLYDADFVLVNLNRANLDDSKILSANPKQSLVSILFTKSTDSAKRIAKINYSYSPIETKSPATYPLKAIDLAWQELQSGNGYITDKGNNPEGNITVRKAYLAYFEAEEKQNFLQPIYVFEGDNGFLGYCQAIDAKWLAE